MRSVLTMLAFAGKEIRQVIRQPKLVVVLVIGPFLILGLFAIGFDPSPPPLRTVMVMPPESELAPSVDVLVGDLEGVLDVIDVIDDQATALRMLGDGQTELVVVVPAHPTDSIQSGEPALVRVFHNRVDPFERSAIAVSAQTAVDHLNRAVLGEVVTVGQHRAGGAVEASAAASDAAAALAEAMRNGDDSAPAARQELDRALAELEVALGGGIYVGALTGAAGGVGLLAEVAEMRTQVDAMGTDDQETAGRLQGDLADFEDQMAAFQSVPSEVLVEPFVLEVETVSGVEVPITTYYMPAVLVVLLQHVVVTFAALSIVSERATGATELFRVGPVRTTELLVGKAIGYVVIGLVVAAALVVGVVYALGAPMAGDWGWLAAVLGLIILASLGLGFVIAAVAESDAQAVQYAMLALLFTLFFSGLVVSWDRLAEGVRYLAFLVPATTGTAALQDVMFRGRAPAPWLVLILAGYTLATLLLARWSVGRQAVA